MFQRAAAAPSACASRSARWRRQPFVPRRPNAPLKGGRWTRRISPPPQPLRPRVLRRSTIHSPAPGIGARSSASTCAGCSWASNKKVQGNSKKQSKEQFMAKTALQFRHNGSDVAIFVDGGVNLLTALRELLGDMTPKFGCGQGGCGACMVLIDGDAHLSCLTLAETVEGRSVETLDSLKDGPNLHPLQRAFMEHFAAQCGYCTPGMLMAAKALLNRNPAPTRDEVVNAVSGNICRCTGYEPIINAVLAAASGGRASA